MEKEEETVRNSVKMALMDLSVVGQKEFTKIHELETDIHKFPHFFNLQRFACTFIRTLSFTSIFLFLFFQCKFVVGIASKRICILTT